MSNWIQPLQPIAGAQEIDFGQRLASGTDVAGQARSVTLAGVGNLSPGEWTLYILRLCYLVEPDLVAAPVLLTSVSLQAGTDKGRGDLLGLERSTFGVGQAVQTMANLNRGTCFHIAAGTMDCTISYLPGTRQSDDRLLCWVAPGRPQITRLEGQGLTSATTIALSEATRMRIPVFARRVRFSYDNDAAVAIVRPFVSFWAGPTFVTAFYMPAPAAFASSDVSFVIPQAATHMSVGDDGAAAVPQQLYFQYEIES
jgi:hypothetical protein